MEQTPVPEQTAGSPTRQQLLEQAGALLREAAEVQIAEIQEETGVRLPDHIRLRTKRHLVFASSGVAASHATATIDRELCGELTDGDKEGGVIE